MRVKDEETGEYLGPSRSQQRRDALEVLALGEQLVALSEGQLAKLPVPESLLPHTRMQTHHGADRAHRPRRAFSLLRLSPRRAVAHRRLRHFRAALGAARRIAENRDRGHGHGCGADCHRHRWQRRAGGARRIRTGCATGGGGIFVTTPLTATDIAFAGNKAEGSGGGLACSQCVGLRVLNSSFTANSAAYGGGLYVSAAAVSNYAHVGRIS